MNCIECKEAIYSLPNTTRANLPQEIKEHIAECSSCAKEYEDFLQVATAVKPQHEIHAPLLLKQNILQHLSNREVTMKNEKTKRAIIRPIIKRIIGIAAAILLFVIVIPFLGKHKSANATAAEILFAKAINAIESVKTVVIKFNVRADPKDNFGLIGKEYDMVGNTMYKSFGKPNKWKIEKNGRTVLFDGNTSYLWIPSIKLAKNYDGETVGMLDWFRILLYPSNILLNEREASAQKDSKITINNKGEETLVSIVSKPDGNLIYKFLGNSTISGSNNRREYVFDKKTNLLKSLKIYLLDAGKETLIFETTSVTYDSVIADDVYKINLPQGIEWQKYQIPQKDSVTASLDAKQTAELIFNDLSKGNFETHKIFWDGDATNKLQNMFKQYKECLVLEVGKPITVLPSKAFVPYKIQLKNGRIKSWIFSMNNDNPNKVWVFDGGL